MTIRQSLTAFLVALLLVGSLSGIALAAPEYTQVDDNHPLDDPDSFKQFNSEGKISSELIAPNMSITISKTASGVGMESQISNYSTTYLKIEYHEDKPRVVRIYIPNNYFTPYEDDLEPVVGDKTATIEPVRNRNYTSVKVEFTGEGDSETVIYEISELSGEASSAKDGWFVSDMLSDDGSEYNPKAEEWQYINSSDISDSTEIEVENIDGDYSIQYLAGEDEWKPVPESETSSDPYYMNFRDGVDDTVWVISTESETPQLRYKQSQSNIEKAGEVGSGISDIGKSILEDINNIIDGGILS